MPRNDSQTIPLYVPEDLSISYKYKLLKFDRTSWTYSIKFGCFLLKDIDMPKSTQFKLKSCNSNCRSHNFSFRVPSLYKRKEEKKGLK